MLNILIIKQLNVFYLSVSTHDYVYVGTKNAYVNCLPQCLWDIMKIVYKFQNIKIVIKIKIVVSSQYYAINKYNKCNSPEKLMINHIEKSKDLLVRTDLRS